MKLNANLTSATQALIKASTYGCSGCADGYYLEYIKINGFYIRKCIAVPTERLLAAESIVPDIRR